MLIFLIGMMSSGKTTVGRRLAQILEYDFIDTDELIEEEAKISIKDLIDNMGIEHFRTLEHKMLHNYSYNINTVISTGGGIILNEDNVLFMKNNGVVVYLNVSIDILMERLNQKETEKRPLLKDKTIMDIYNERKELYETSCEVNIKCDSLAVDDICKDIIIKLT